LIAALRLDDEWVSVKEAEQESELTEVASVLIDDDIVMGKGVVSAPPGGVLLPISSRSDLVRGTGFT
jgi:hypothetical protein